MPSRRRSRIALALAAALCLGAGGAAQQPQRPPQDEPLETLKVDVNVVNLFFNVKRKNALVAGLTKDDFEVYEDGVKQNIRYFSAEANQPLTLGLLVDTSGSMQRVLPMEKEVGAEFLRQVIREKDLAFLISFDVQVELLQDFTASVNQLRGGLDRTRINTGGNVGGLPGMGGGPVPIRNPRGTLLFDAVYLASAEKLAREVGRKAIVILSDGADQGSRSKLTDAIEAAQKADVITYVLLMQDREFTQYGNGEGDMKKLAEQTGGRIFDVGDDQKRLRQAFEQISNELRSQYNIGYTPTNQKKDGSFRKVEVKVNKDRDAKVQVRRGYYAPVN